MFEERSSFTGCEGEELNYIKWSPENESNIVIQIIHGMAEHKERYKDFANFLTERNITVYIADIRGHGDHIDSEMEGFFHEEDGWDKVIKDRRIFTEKIAGENEGIALFIFGHSMGSLILRDYITRYKTLYNGIILSGTASPIGLQGHAAKLIIKNSLKKGRKNKNHKLDAMVFGGNNKPFEPSRTKFDWLSRDEKIVDEYIDDDKCGFVCTTQFFDDLLYGLMRLDKKANIQMIRKDIPILMFSGEMDPVGGLSKGVKKVYKRYKKAGINDITLKLYKDNRHECLNELNKNEVYTDIVDWIKAKI